MLVLFSKTAPLHRISNSTSDYILRQTVQSISNIWVFAYLQSTLPLKQQPEAIPLRKNVFMVILFSQAKASHSWHDCYWKDLVALLCHLCAHFVSCSRRVIKHRHESWNAGSLDTADLQDICLLWELLASWIARLGGSKPCNMCGCPWQQ